MKVRVEVPASSGNLGPGFDVLGLALERTNEVIAESQDQDITITVAGIGIPPVMRDPAQSLLVKAYHAGCDAISVDPAKRGVALRSTHRIPVARGMGSSAAAIVAGLLVANTLHRGALSNRRLITLATELDGHPDNVAASLLGGLAVCTGGIAASVLPHPELRCVVLIAETTLETEAARAVLPESYTRADAIHNIGNTALLVHAIESGDHALLRVAMSDRLHQPYREPLLPALTPVLEAAVKAGARGAALSGAGPSVIALTDSYTDSIEIAMSVAAAAAGVNGDAIPFEIRRRPALAEMVQE